MDTFVVLVSLLLLLNIDDLFGDKNDECISYKQFEEVQSRLSQLESYERRITSMEKILQERSVSGRAIEGEGVAFSAVLSGTLHNIGLKQPIRFNTVQLNENNGYNMHTGAFTAPTDGVYLFSYFLGHGNVGQMWLELMHNGNKINAGVTDGFNNYEDDQGGNVAVIRLVAGDTVWVENWHQNDSDLDGAYGFTTFSGVLIYI